MSGSLDLPVHSPRRATTLRRAAFGAVTVLLPVSWLVWYANTPSELPVTAREVRDTVTTGTSVYIGMFNAPAGFDRTLHMSGIKVHTVATSELEVTPLLCRDGAVTATTAPEVFCSDIVDPEGEDFTAGDAILVEVRSEHPTVAVVDRISIGFREGIRWGTRPAGVRQAALTIVDAGSQDGDEGSDDGG